MILLALDTTAESCSVALWRDGEVFAQLETIPRTHTRRLMPMIRSLLSDQGLAPADLSAVAFGRGPGSFTGLRIAAGVTQGLAFGLDCPVVPVSSLAACAYQAWLQYQAPRIAVAFDARMNEVYWGCYAVAEGELVLCGDERICPPEAVALPTKGQDWFGAGDGWNLSARMPTDITAAVTTFDASVVPTAEAIVRLAARDFARGVAYDAAAAAPVYLRDSVAWQKLPGR
jgi:tRNA threonylcarbamoyladenosine biosynthesis protein TsaB